MSESSPSPTDANPLLQPALGPAVPNPDGEQVLAVEAPPEDLDIALGQIIELRTDTEQGKQYNNTRGLVYYYEPSSLLKVQVDGLPSKLVEVPIVEVDRDDEGPIYDFDPDLLNKPIKVLQTTNFVSFVEIVGFQPGQVLDSFKNGLPGPILLVKEPVDAKRDSMDVIELDNDLNEIDSTRRTLNFHFIGIERDEAFDVLRPRGILEELKKKAEALDEPGVVAPGVSEEEAPSSEFVFEEIEIPKIQGLQVLAQKDIAATDDEQRGDMITDLRRNPLPEWRGKTLTKDEYLRYVDMLMRLRNDIVEYSADDTPTGEVKPTSITMLIELLESGLPLARPVLDARLNLFVDDTGIKAKHGDKLSAREQEKRNEVEITLLEDVVKQSIASITPLETTSKAKAAASTEADKDVPQEIAVVNVNVDPLFIEQNKNFIKNYFQSWRKGIARPVKPIQDDTDFFRMDIPKFKTDKDGNLQFETRVTGFPKLSIDSTRKLTDDYLGSVKFSVRRALKERKGKPAENLQLINGRRIDTRGLITVSNADTAAIYNYIIFPYLTTRSLGPTRSGKLLFDSYRAANCITLIEDIFTILNGINVVPTADSIFVLNKTKENALENIQISEWIKNIPVNSRSFEDFEDLFISIGLAKYEINEEQFKVIRDAIRRDYARRVAAVRKLREKANEIAKKIPEFETRPFSQTSEVEVVEEGAVVGAEQETLLKVLLKQDKLREALSKLRKISPAYKNVDLAILSYMQILYPDYVSAAISENVNLIVRERQILAKQIFQDSVQTITLEEKKKRSAGQQPIVNECAHAKDLVKMRTEKDVTKRMLLLRKLYENYHKGEKGNWYTCVDCNYPLMCKHEYLQIQQFLHPNESKVLYKNLLLNFSGGQFQGHYICKGCGQPISELEYDDNVEFDDNGVPKVGHAPLEMDEDGKQKEIDDFNGPSVDEDGGTSMKIKGFEEEREVKRFRGSGYCGFEKPTNYRVLNCIRSVAAYLYHCVGVTPGQDIFQHIVEKSYNILLKTSSAEALSESKEFKKLLTKDREFTKKKGINVQNYLNQQLVCNTAALILVDVQTHTPPYEIKFSMPGCQATFKGYPLSGKKEEIEAINYMKCILLLTKKNEVPWTKTGWYGINKEILGNYILNILTGSLDQILEDSDIQGRLEKKRIWLEKTYGEGADKEKLPKSFLPVPYNPADKSTAVELVESAANTDTKMQILLRKAHSYAKASKDENVVETTDTTISCCFDSITEPGKFWSEKDIPSPGTTKPTGPRGTRLTLHYSARPQPKIRLEAPESLYSRVFLKVCYQGPRKGLPHEPGYNNICPYCELDFGQDPATYDNVDKEGAAALDAAEVVRDQEHFQDLLDAVHTKLKVVPPPRPTKVDYSSVVLSLSRLDPAPYPQIIVKKTDDSGVAREIVLKGWKSHFQPFRVLPENATDEARIEALSEMETRMTEHEKTLRARLGKVNLKKCGEDVTTSGETGDMYAVDILKQLAELPPEEIVNFLRTYIIIPFNRGVTNKTTAPLQHVLQDYELGQPHREEIVTKILIPQSGPASNFKDFFNDPTLEEDVRKSRRESAQLFIKKLHAITEVLKNLRKKVLKTQSDTVIKTLTKSMIYGAFVAYDEAGLRSHIRCFLGKYYNQGKRYTAEEIRRVIAEIAEMEKQRFINKTKDKSAEEKRLDRMLRQLGMGDYAIGGTKAIWAYDPERWEKEREDRIKNGQIDWLEGPDDISMPQGRRIGKDGMPIVDQEGPEMGAAHGDMEDET